jgi:hypothetical protein
VCFLCGEDKNELILAGAFGGKEAPRRGVWNKEPCDKCKSWMEKGVILIEVSEKLTEDEQNPYRCGGWSVLRDEAIKRMPFDDEVLEDMLTRRVAFITDEVWTRLGIPRENIPEVKDEKGT